MFWVNSTVSASDEGVFPSTSYQVSELVPRSHYKLYEKTCLPPIAIKLGKGTQLTCTFVSLVLMPFVIGCICVGTT